MGDIEEILVEKAKKGDLKSFEALVTQYQKKIFAFVFRMVISEEDARDLTQEVFIQVFKSLDTFRGEAKFSTWLYRIASNKCLDFLRRKKSTQYYDGEELERNLTDNPLTIMQTPEQIFIQREKILKVRNLINNLPDKYRLVLVLFHYENLSYQQIATALEIPEKTVATRLYRAKIMLKELLGGDKDEV